MVQILKTWFLTFFTIFGEQGPHVRRMHNSANKGSTNSNTWKCFMFWTIWWMVTYSLKKSPLVQSFFYQVIFEVASRQIYLKNGLIKLLFTYEKFHAFETIESVPPSVNPTSCCHYFTYIRPIICSRQYFKCTKLPMEKKFLIWLGTNGIFQATILPFSWQICSKNELKK